IAAASILIAAASLLTQAENASLPDVTIVPLATSSRSPAGARSCIAAMTRIIMTAGRAQKARATDATIAKSGMLRLLPPTPTLADASKSALFPYCHRIDAAFVCLRCVGALPPRKKCVVDKCHKSFIFYTRHLLQKRFVPNVINVTTF